MVNDPNNFVADILEVEHPLPPITWTNWYREVDYPRVFILIVLPIIGFIASWFYPLRVETLTFTFFYTYIMGISKSSPITPIRE
jgi:stearoyl-CoA desaturase (delta-9 desaturase)